MGKFNVGDVVVTLEKCGWAKGGQGLMLAGAIGKVKAVDGDLLTVKFNKKQPTPNATKQARKNFVVKTSEVRVATAEESATIAKKKKAEYVPQEGDIVVVTANNTCSSNNVGDIGKVGAEKPLGDGGVCVYVPNGPTSRVRTWPSDIRKATPAEVEAYEQALLSYEKALHKASFSVGDYVKIVKSERGNEGKIAKITRIDEGLTSQRITGEFAPVDFEGRIINDETSYGLNAEAIVKATDKEVEQAKKPKLKAGDFVKFEEPDLYDITVGKIYEVQTDYAGDLCIIDDAGDEDCSYLAEFAIKVDAEEAKWAKLGRKVDEYKVGDIIKITRDQHGDPVGTITKVIRVHERGTVTYKSVSNGTYLGDFDAIKLIAPVESTLN